LDRKLVKAKGNQILNSSIIIKEKDNISSVQLKASKKENFFERVG